MELTEAEESSGDATAQNDQSVFRQMYRITADREASFEEKTRALIDLGREHLDLPYGFVTRIEDRDPEEREPSQSTAESSSEAERMQRIVYASGEHPLLQEGEVCPLSEAYCRKTIRHEELLSIQRTTAEGWSGDSAQERFELGCYIGSRVVVEGELYGTFCFGSRKVRGRPFSDAEEAFVELLTRWASYELERRRSRSRVEQFAELVTHDLRNPLNAAQVNLAMLKRLLEEDGAEASKLQKCLARADHSLDRMEAIITDTLALAHGEQVLRPDDLAPIQLRNVVEASWAQAGDAEATLAFDESLPEESPTDAQAPLMAHEGRLRQLLENLMRNAIDHAGPEVTVSIGRTDDGFFIADDGPGLPSDEREKVFETGYSSRDGGTGLGLAIAQAVAQAHGWTLSATESARGGARFDISGVERPST